MIEILSSIASILGFSLQLYDKFNDLNPKSSKNEDEIILLFLKELSVKSRAIKEIHQKYHSLHGDMRPVAVFLSNPYLYEKIEVKQKRLRIELKKALQGPNIAIAQRHMQKQLANCFNELKIIPQEEELLATKIEGSHVPSELKSQLKKIISSQTEIESLHNKFCDVIRKIGNFSKGDWGESEYSYILENHSILTVDFYQIIDYADICLMSYLDIYHYVSSCQ